MSDFLMNLQYSSAKWIDISMSLHETIVHWPGDPPFEKMMVEEIDKGSLANVSKLTLGSHTGTHVDAPLHYLPNGQDISILSLDSLVGPARVIEIMDPGSIEVEELKAKQIQPGERLLFKTRNSIALRNKTTFTENFVALSSRAAEYLVRQGIKTVGIDYLSIGPYQNGEIVHRILLEHNIGIIEGLDLAQVKAGPYFLVCLPLKIMSGDGAPARAIVYAL
jgi:arylformamidase